MTVREDEIAWRERLLDEKEHELNRMEGTLAEKERSLKAAANTIQRGLEYLQIQLKLMSDDVEKRHGQLMPRIQLLAPEVQFVLIGRIPSMGGLQLVWAT
jgi:TATA-binding protein-associated factor Taf7